MRTSLSQTVSPGRHECEIVRAVAITLIEEGYRIRTEVPNMGQSADIVATRSRWLTAIEAKTKDWKTALRQCRAHELVADFICVAVGTVGVSDELQQAVRDAGYGLMHCPPGDSTCKWVIRPRRNISIWHPERTRLSRTMRVIEYES